MEPFIEQFLAPEEGAARAAVKRLTATIERELVEATVNAPDWCVGVLLDSSKLTLPPGTSCIAREWRENFSGRTNDLSAWTILCR